MATPQEEDQGQHRGHDAVALPSSTRRRLLEVRRGGSRVPITSTPVRSTTIVTIAIWRRSGHPRWRRCRRGREQRERVRDGCRRRLGRQLHHTPPRGRRGEREPAVHEAPGSAEAGAGGEKIRSSQPPRVGRREQAPVTTTHLRTVKPPRLPDRVRSPTDHSENQPAEEANQRRPW